MTDAYGYQISYVRNCTTVQEYIRKRISQPLLQALLARLGYTLFSTACNDLFSSIRSRIR